MAHTERVHVEYRDLDPGGAAHSTCAMLWAERAEHALLQALELGPTFQRRHVEIDYLAPVKLGDWVHATPETQKATRRMQFYSATIMAGDDIVARCSGIYKLSDENRAEPTDQS